MAQVVEHILGKDEVSSSNLLSSSTRKPLKPLIFQVSAVFLFLFYSRVKFRLS